MMLQIALSALAFQGSALTSTRRSTVQMSEASNTRYAHVPHDSLARVAPTPALEDGAPARERPGEAIARGSWASVGACGCEEVAGALARVRDDACQSRFAHRRSRVRARPPLVLRRRRRSNSSPAAERCLRRPWRPSAASWSRPSRRPPRRVRARSSRSLAWRSPRTTSSWCARSLGCLAAFQFVCVSRLVGARPQARAVRSSAVALGQAAARRVSSGLAGTHAPICQLDLPREATRARAEVSRAGSAAAGRAASARTSRGGLPGRAHRPLRCAPRNSPACPHPHPPIPSPPSRPLPPSRSRRPSRSTPRLARTRTRSPSRRPTPPSSRRSTRASCGSPRWYGAAARARRQAPGASCASSERDESQGSARRRAGRIG